MDEGKVTIVAVDDDEGHTELVRRNLRRAGVANQIVSIRTGDEALAFAFRRGLYADRSRQDELLFLLDINMPGGIDGIEVLRRLKADPETRRIPVIMLTTTDDPREVDRCYDLGCNVYITKPVQPAAFVEAISRLGLLISVISLPADGQRTS